MTLFAHSSADSFLTDIDTALNCHTSVDRLRWHHNTFKWLQTQPRGDRLAENVLRFFCTLFSRRQAFVDFTSEYTHTTSPGANLPAHARPKQNSQHLVSIRLGYHDTGVFRALVSRDALASIESPFSFVTCITERGRTYELFVLLSLLREIPPRVCSLPRRSSLVIVSFLAGEVLGYQASYFVCRARAGHQHEPPLRAYESIDYLRHPRSLGNQQSTHT